MDIKIVKKGGIVAALSLAVAMAAGLAGWVPVGAQDTGAGSKSAPSTQNGGSARTITAISNGVLTVAQDKQAGRQVRVDASTLVFKNGTVAGVSMLKVGDKIVVDPTLSLPGDMENRNGTPAKETQNTSPSSPSTGQGNPADKKNVPGSDNSSSQSDNANGNGSANTGNTTSNPPAQSAQTYSPNQPKQDTPRNTGSTGAPSAQSANGSGAPASVSAARIIWVQSAASSEKLISGTVRSVQGGTLILYLPAMAYSDYAVQLTNNTAYKLSGKDGLLAIRAGDLKMGTQVVVIGTDTATGKGASSAGIFTAKTVLAIGTSSRASK